MAGIILKSKASDWLAAASGLWRMIGDSREALDATVYGSRQLSLTSPKIDDTRLMRRYEGGVDLAAAVLEEIS
jgi:hypothetical protein